MFRSDAQQQQNSSVSINMLNIEMIALIQKEIDPYDMISLVFLLYENPDTALQRLVIYQRVSMDIDGNDTNLLHDWVVHSQSRPTWRNEFLEALTTCQLYSIIRKLGLNVSAVKQFYQNSGNNTLIHPMKKALYKLCEHMNTENIYKLKKTLLTYEIDCTDYESCELIFLDLMCRRFISISKQNARGNSDCGIENLAKIIDNFSDVQSFADELRRIEDIHSDKSKVNDVLFTSTPSASVKDVSKEEDNTKKYANDLSDVFKWFNGLNVDDIPDKELKSDTKLLSNDAYPIKDSKNVGVCLIINQEKFHPSKESITGNVQSNLLGDRLGSTKDKEALKSTMSGLNFEVITYDNINHQEMFEKIKDVVKYRVHDNHSMFMLCILSHGTKGHVYAADSVKVKVEDIESLLDSDEFTKLRHKPKLIILQACQDNNDDPYIPMVADSPRPVYRHYIKKSDFIIYWATAPGYESFRHEEMGSIFIQMLCETLKHYSGTDHVNDLFTRVNYLVKRICVSLKRDQLPKVEHTLMKKLYLQIPEKSQK
ncbi:caspase-8 [Ostrinia nubilalis]|uniref:caspase-8 n=1 Tax=Ostrinia nubilalis TaxID=29057 RepID=UPI0030823EFB